MNKRGELVNRKASEQISKLMANLDAVDNDTMIHAITTKLILAQFSAGEANNHRLDAGRMLLVLRGRIEAKGENWWKWYHNSFTRSRRDAEKVMAMASAADPVAAAKQAAMANAYHQANHRKKSSAAYVSRNGARADGANVSSSGNVIHLNRNQAAEIRAIMEMIRALSEQSRDELFAAIEEEFHGKGKASKDPDFGSFEEDAATGHPR